MKTRAKLKSGDAVVQQTSIKQTAPVPEANPPCVLLLPSNASSEASFITLRNPATLEAERYYFCPKSGLHEIRAVGPSEEIPRSWLLSNAEDGTEPSDTMENPATRGYLLQKPSLLVATMIDPAFLMLPALCPNGNSEVAGMFLEFDEYIDALTLHSPQFQQCCKHSAWLSVLEERIAGICDVKDLGDQKLYRFSDVKLAQQILLKAKRLCSTGLPTSMEDRYVNDRLRAATVSHGEENVTNSEGDEGHILIRQDAGNPDAVDGTENALTAGTKFQIRSDTDAEAGSTTKLARVRQTLQLRTALNFLLASYVPKNLQARLKTLVLASDQEAFDELEQYLASLLAAKKEAQALQSVSDNVSRKRAAADDEVAAAHEEKRRKQQEEDQRRKSESRGVKNLRKVNTEGMKKLSSFFTKVPT